jgi:hypothetical protein
LRATPATTRGHPNDRIGCRAREGQSKAAAELPRLAVAEGIRPLPERERLEDHLAGTRRGGSPSLAPISTSEVDQVSDKRLFGMPTKIVGGIAAIALVAVLTAGGTIAYFSGTQDRGGNTIATATIGVNSNGFPLSFQNMLPGDWQYLLVDLKNESSAPADLYMQMLGDMPETGFNFCIPNDYLDLRISDLDLGGDSYWDSICKLYPGQATSVIVKVADNLAPGAWKHLQIGLYLDTMAGNDYQGQSNTDTVHLIAVQYNGPAPIPNLNGFESGAYAQGWPADAFGNDDDPNYP